MMVIIQFKVLLYFNLKYQDFGEDVFCYAILILIIYLFTLSPSLTVEIPISCFLFCCVFPALKEVDGT